MSKIRSPQFGAILFRASELIGRQGTQVFDSLGFKIPASRISIVLAIHQNGPSSSSELSSHIGISRQLIESRLKSSVRDGIFVAVKDAHDFRKKVYDFADDIRDEVQRVICIMLDFEKVYDELWSEIGIDIETALKLMEKALNNNSLEQRLFDLFPKYRAEVEDS